MYILGLNVFHDATATLLKEGTIIASVGEERLSRVKNHWGFPFRATEECLKIGHISGKEIDSVAFSFNNTLDQSPRYLTDCVIQKSGILDPLDELEWDLRRAILVDKMKRPFLNGNYWSSCRDYALGSYRRTLQSFGISASNLLTKDHHLSHAASAYYDSGYPECIIFTADGSGDGLSMTASVGLDGNISRLHAISNRNSLGAFYAAITKFLGFKMNRHEGKITGLAAYGDPSVCYKKLQSLMSICEGDRSFTVPLLDERSNFINKAAEAFHFIKGDYYSCKLANLRIDYLNKYFATEKKEDIAAAAQKLLEDLMVRYVKSFLIETGLENVVLAGGVFANVKVNQRIAEIPGVASVFIHPNMGDGGTATGAAYLAWAGHMEQTGKKFYPRKITEVYYGPEYSDTDIHGEVARSGFSYNHHNDVEKKVACLVSQKKIVGRFHGRMEYGPRALGNRSILADPTDKTINDWLNQRLKRTEFMPFAPSVKYEAATQIFKGFKPGEDASAFMTITFDVEKSWQERAAAVCHVDGTARPQVVKSDVNPSYHKILTEYERLTGLPLMVNTSFNAHEEPIVCSPRDAVKALADGCIDVLAIGNFVVGNSIEDCKKIPTGD
jgi:carbamoyltransferase